MDEAWDVGDVRVLLFNGDIWNLKKNHWKTKTSYFFFSIQDLLPPAIRLIKWSYFNFWLMKTTFFKLIISSYHSHIYLLLDCFFLPETLTDLKTQHRGSLRPLQPPFDWWSYVDVEDVNTAGQLALRPLKLNIHYFDQPRVKKYINQTYAYEKYK